MRRQATFEAAGQTITVTLHLTMTRQRGDTDDPREGGFGLIEEQRMTDKSGQRLGEGIWRHLPGSGVGLWPWAVSDSPTPRRPGISWGLVKKNHMQEPQPPRSRFKSRSPDTHIPNKLPGDPGHGRTWELLPVEPRRGRRWAQKSKLV